MNQYAKQESFYSMERESFASRAGFLLMAAGCSIGLGNVWRFPFVAGQNGGAFFVLIYLIFLSVLGFPILVAELAMGRASAADLPGAYSSLRNEASPLKHWSAIGHISMVGNLVLLMFYTVVSSWTFSYAWNYLVALAGTGMDQTIDYTKHFSVILGSWKQMLLFTSLGILVTGLFCIRGLRGGMERAVKIMMCGLFLLQGALAIYAICLPGSGAGLRFFLAPDWNKVTASGVWNVIHAAMAQSFFTLSLGIGSMEILGSYMKKENSLSKEAWFIIVLDTFVAITSGLIIFPVCFSFNVNPDAGPSLIFITLPRIFSAMPGGKILGLVFFLFLAIASLSTLIAVAENLIAYGMRVFRISRVKSTWICSIVLLIASLPCLFGFNLWKNVQPLGKGSTILDLEDFIVSSNLLPLGAMSIVLFCSWRYGWGAERFLAEANTGKGMTFPRWLIPYMKYVLPLLIFGLWVYEYVTKFF